MSRPLVSLAFLSAVICITGSSCGSGEPVWYCQRAIEGPTTPAFLPLADSTANGDSADTAAAACIADVKKHLSTSIQGTVFANIPTAQLTPECSCSETPLVNRSPTAP